MKTTIIFFAAIFMSFQCASQGSWYTDFIGKADKVAYSLDVKNPERFSCLILAGKIDQPKTSICKLKNFTKLRVLGIHSTILREAGRSFLLKQISRVTNLEYLSFGGFRIDSVFFYDFVNSKIKWLSFMSCQLKYIDSSIVNLSKLEYLDLGPGTSELRRPNSVSDLPRQIKDLKHLSEIDYYSNSLSVLPGVIKELKTLKKLDLGGNQLKEIDDDILNLQNLTELVLSGNSLSKIPLNFERLRNLKYLSLSDNNLGEVIMKMKFPLSLKYLNISSNKLDSLPVSIYELKNLFQLSAEKNKISTLNSNFCSLSNLHRIYLGGNNLDLFPDVLMKLRGLIHISLNHNQIMAIPRNLCKLKKLKSIDLRYNPISNSSFLRNCGIELIK